MAKGYIIFTEHVRDADALAAYTTAAVPSVVAAGARPIIIGSPARVAEGEWHGHTTVVLEFDSIDAANSWYDSDSYQAVVGLRHQAATSNVAFFEGFAPPTAV